MTIAVGSLVDTPRGAAEVTKVEPGGVEVIWANQVKGWYLYDQVVEILPEGRRTKDNRR